METELRARADYLIRCIREACFDEGIEEAPSGDKRKAESAYQRYKKYKGELVALLQREEPVAVAWRLIDDCPEDPGSPHEWNWLAGGGDEPDLECINCDQKAWLCSDTSPREGRDHEATEKFAKLKKMARLPHGKTHTLSPHTAYGRWVALPTRCDLRDAILAGDESDV